MSKTIYTIKVKPKSALERAESARRDRLNTGTTRVKVWGAVLAVIVTVIPLVRTASPEPLRVSTLACIERVWSVPFWRINTVPI